MEKNLLKFYLLGFFLLSNFIMFAQIGPGDDDDTGGLEGDDPPAAPINGKILWLLILGIVYVVYTLNSNRKKT